jgi:hypothetical protein
VTLYDKEAFLGQRAREWTMGIHWAYHIFQALLPENIYKDLQCAYTDPFHSYDNPNDKIPFYNGMTGQILFALPAGPIRRVSRTKMRRHITQGLDIQWGKKFVDAKTDSDTGPVTILFEDGSQAEADLVVGADGSNSPVRQWLLGPEAGSTTAADIVLFNGLVAYNDADMARNVRKHPLATLVYYAGGVMFIGGTVVSHLSMVKKPRGF